MCVDDEAKELLVTDFLGWVTNKHLESQIIALADTPPNNKNFRSLRLTSIIGVHKMDYDDIFDTDLINNDLILDDKDFTKFDDKLEQPQEAQLPAKQSKSLTQSISDIVHSLWEFDSEGIFHKPVNTKLLRDYTKLIKFPMDLSTVKSKSCYKDLDALKADLLLISNNAKMYNPPDNYFHSKAIEFESFFLSLLQQESSNYVIVDDKPVVHQSLPIAWGVYSEDEEESEDEDVKPTEPSPLVHQVDDAQQPKPSYQLDVFNPSQFLDNLRLYSEPNPVVPLNTPSIYAKKSRIQKKRLTKKEQEQLEKDPYQKNADGSIKADECGFNLIVLTDDLHIAS